ncbi:MAG: hypothetical protein AAFV53_28275 [Myxococcota bacterium]
MSLRGELLQAVRTLLKQVLALPDAQVVPDARHQLRNKPALVFPEGEDHLTVFVSQPEIPLYTTLISSTDESGESVRLVSGMREGLVEINAFGDAASDWLSDFNLALFQPDVTGSFLTTLGVSVLPRDGGITDLSGIRDTAFTARFLVEHTLRYRLVSDPVPVAAVGQVDLSFTIHQTPAPADDPSPFILSSSVFAPSVPPS